MHILKSIDDALQSEWTMADDARIESVANRVGSLWDALRLRFEPYPGGVRCKGELVTSTGVRTRFSVSAVCISDLTSRVVERVVRLGASQFRRAPLVA